MDNLRAKEALCAEVESLVAGEEEDADPREVAGKIAELQKRWDELTSREMILPVSEVLE